MDDSANAAAAAAESEDIAGLMWPDRPDNFHFHFACQLCKAACQPADPTNREHRCSRCKLVVYCCQAHKRLDKAAHRPFCQAVRRHRKLSPGGNLFSDAIGLDASEFWRLRQSKMLAISGLLGRSLAPWERQALTYPRLCCVCYSDRRLSLCPVCLSAAFCCPEHRRQHEAAHRGNAVSHAKLFNAYLLLRELHCCGLPESPIELYQPRMNSYKPLEVQPRLDLLNADDAPSLLPQFSVAHSAVSDATEADEATASASSGSPIAPWVRQALVSEAASYPLTVLYVWEQVRPPPGPSPLSSRRSLTIRIANWPSHLPPSRANWELLLHRLPTLRQLRIVFLNEAEADSADQESGSSQVALCKACRAVNCRIEVERQSLSCTANAGVDDEAADEPDAVCLFNLRRPLFNSTSAVPLLLRPSGAPLVATFESARHCRQFPRLLLASAAALCSRTRYPNGVNPAFSCLPRRAPIEADCDPACCHTNWYLSVLWAD